MFTEDPEEKVAELSKDFPASEILVAHEVAFSQAELEPQRRTQRSVTLRVWMSEICRAAPPLQLPLRSVYHRRRVKSPVRNFAG